MALFGLFFFLSPVQRSAYKDLVLLLQRDGYLSDSQLRRKVIMPGLLLMERQEGHNPALEWHGKSA
jgi:hypothetical protein